MLVSCNADMATRYQRKVLHKLDGSETVTISAFDGFCSTAGGRLVTAFELTPDYWSRLKRGELLPYTSYNVSTSSTIVVDPVWNGGRRKLWNPDPTCDRLYEKYSYTAAAVTSLKADVPVPSPVDFDRLVQKAAANAKDGALMVLVELIESRKTVEAYKGLRESYEKRADRVMRKTKSKYPKLRKSKDILDAFGDTWLEFNFGHAQLYYSAMDCKEAFAALTRDEDSFVVKGHARQIETGETQSVTCSAGGPSFSATVSDQRGLISDVCRSTVAVQISKNAAAVDTNLPAFLWEITPWSWVVDYIVNLSDIFRAHWPNPGVTAMVAMYSKKRTTSLRCNYELPSVECNLDASGGFILWKREEYTRTPVKDIPLNLSLNPGIPGWKQISLTAAAVQKKVPNLVKAFPKIRS